MNSDVVRDSKNGNADLLIDGQIALAEISLYNWGSFHGLHTATIDRGGTLITGDNGAGKSTIIDGLMALLLPSHKALFNVAAAQGEKGDRSVISYIRGNYGTAHDGSKTQQKYRRNGAVVSGLRALYRSDGGSEITLLALFWLSGSTSNSSDLKRLYLLAAENTQLAWLLQLFTEGDSRKLKQQLKQQQSIRYFDNFAEYQECYSRYLYLPNRNAAPLLARALGLKKIDDLTQLIRELVLEPGEVKRYAQEVVAEFDDLVAVHRQLVDARKQFDALQQLPQVQQELQQSADELQWYSDQRSALPAYFGAQSSQLWQQKIAVQQQALQQLEQQLHETEQQMQTVSERLTQRQMDYVAVGGGKIESLQQRLEALLQQLQQIRLQQQRYSQLAQQQQLVLPDSPQQLQHNLQNIDQQLQQIDSNKQQAMSAFSQIAADLGSQQLQLQQLQKQLQQMQSTPNSNIAPAYLQLRQQICTALQLPTTALLFVGECIEIMPQQSSWQGAIERALGAVATTVLLAEQDYPQVTAWLEQQQTNLLVRLQVVTTTPIAQLSFVANGILEKLSWLHHPWREWLQYYLRDHDLQCVDSVQQLQQTEYSITINGLIHYGAGQFVKDDNYPIDDSSLWQTGFSNQQRFTTLQQQLQQQQQQTTTLQQQLQQSRSVIDELEQQKQRLQQLQQFSWQQIDSGSLLLQQQQLQQQLQQLTASEGAVESAQQQIEETKQLLQQFQQQKSSLDRQFGKLESQLKQSQQQLHKAEAAAQHQPAPAIADALQQRIGMLQTEQMESVTELEQQHRSELEKLENSSRSRYQNAVKQGVGIMVGYRKEWPLIAGNWGREVESMRDYLQHLQHLQQDGLPQLAQKFRQRLQRHAGQSLARLRASVDSEREEIALRIETINTVLARTEFRSGSYLRIGYQLEQFAHVRHFYQQLDELLHPTAVASEDHIFLQLQQVITLLTKAVTAPTSSSLESLRLLDPRYQLAFFAEEIERNSGAIVDVLTSSSGKSGGEKESFAGTIVAASLAYVLTPDGMDRPIYATVFLDEAFSNTAESVSRRVLQVFRALHIHVNLITPYKNLNLARESARSLIIVQRNAEQHESTLCTITWEEIDAKLAS